MCCVLKTSQHWRNNNRHGRRWKFFWGSSTHASRSETFIGIFILLFNSKKLISYFLWTTLFFPSPVYTVDHDHRRWSSNFGTVLRQKVHWQESEKLKLRNKVTLALFSENTREVCRHYLLFIAEMRWVGFTMQISTHAHWLMITAKERKWNKTLSDCWMLEVKKSSHRSSCRMYIIHSFFQTSLIQSLQLKKKDV